MNIDQARATMLDNHPSTEQRLQDFAKTIEKIAPFLRNGNMDEIPETLAIHYQLLGELSASLRELPKLKLTMISSFLEQWTEEMRAPKYEFKRYRFTHFRRESRIPSAAFLLQVSSTELEARILGCPRDLLAADVIAFVIWETAAYVHGTIDWWNVDALKEEYPWIPDFKREH